MVLLLALGLAFGSLGARDNHLLFLMWIHATVPGIICLWLLLAPPIRLFHAGPSRAEPVEA
jgi:lipopolysaccharide export system permease protein